MRCPICKHDNGYLATRCANCGATLPVDPGAYAQGTSDPSYTSQATIHSSPMPNLEPTPIDPDATMPQSNVQRGGTVERPQVSDTGLQPTISNTKTSGIRRALQSLRRSLHTSSVRTGAFFERNQRLVGLGIAVLVLGVLAAAWFGINSTLSAPAYTTIESDVAALLPTYDYVGGAYGPDLQLPLSSTTVTDRSATKTPEGMEVAPGVGPAAYGVEAELTYDDGRIRVVRNVGATYVREGDAWKMAGELTERGTSVTARAGVDENKVLGSMATILEAASSQNDVLLSDLYAGGSFSVVGNVFKETPQHDTATDDVTIRCRQDGMFYAYEGNVIAHFAFESGAWKLRSSEADGKSTTRIYDPLVGTWSGGFITTSTPVDGAACYGAQDKPLSVFIETVGDSMGGTSVRGTITTLAHYHERLVRDAAETTGDTPLEGIDFTGTIDASYDKDTGSDLNLRCTTGGSPEGLVDFVLSFGTADDPSAVIARVTSTHNYEEKILFFIPHQTTATFTDTYALARVA